MNTDDTSSTRDAEGNSDVDNNVDSKNAYIKASFSTYNVAGMGVDDTSSTSEEVSSNTNNTDEGQSSSVSKANKDGLGQTDKSELDEVNKGRMGRANIEAGKKAGAEAITSTDNSADGSSKVTD